MELLDGMLDVDSGLDADVRAGQRDHALVDAEKQSLGTKARGPLMHEY